MKHFIAFLCITIMLLFSVDATNALAAECTEDEQNVFSYRLTLLQKSGQNLIMQNVF